jgi:hypothetical protein
MSCHLAVARGEHRFDLFHTYPHIKQSRFRVPESNLDPSPPPTVDFILQTGSSAMVGRRRYVQNTSLDERLAAEARRLRGEAEKLPPGLERDLLLRQARQTDAAAHMNDWLNSPGLQPPIRTS